MDNIPAHELELQVHVALYGENPQYGTKNFSSDMKLTWNRLVLTLQRIPGCYFTLELEVRIGGSTEDIAYAGAKIDLPNGYKGNPSLRAIDVTAQGHSEARALCHLILKLRDHGILPPPTDEQPSSQDMITD